MCPCGRLEMCSYCSNVIVATTATTDRNLLSYQSFYNQLFLHGRKNEVCHSGRMDQSDAEYSPRVGFPLVTSDFCNQLRLSGTLCVALVVSLRSPLSLRHSLTIGQSGLSLLEGSVKRKTATGVPSLSLVLLVDLVHPQKLLPTTIISWNLGVLVS